MAEAFIWILALTASCWALLAIDALVKVWRGKGYRGVERRSAMRDWRR